MSRCSSPFGVTYDPDQVQSFRSHVGPPGLLSCTAPSFQDLPQPVWDYIRKNGFLGMIIDKKYGGKGFSAHGHALVVQKLSTRSQSVGVSVMVPNSLGPGELLKVGKPCL